MKNEGLSAANIKKIRMSRIIIYGILIFFSIIYLIPIYILFTTSVKSFKEVSLSRMWYFPMEFTLENFKLVWVGSVEQGFNGLGRMFMNSIYVVIPATLISTSVGSLNGYVFSKWKFKYSNVIFSLFLFGMFIPYQSILIPLVETMRRIGLYGSLSGLILAQIIYGIPITTLIFRNYYATIPTELIESARMDGANFFNIYRHIFLPLSIPASAVVVIWQFTSIWNSYLFPAVLTTSPKVQPITVGLVNFAGSYFIKWNIQMAGAVLTALPALIIFLLLGKLFIRGMMAGAIKG